MEIWQLVGSVSPGVAVGVLALFYYNQMAIRMLEDRSEWNDFLQHMIDRYDARLVAAVDAMAKMAAETHALRGKLTEFMASVELKFAAIDNRIRGGNGDD